MKNLKIGAKIFVAFAIVIALMFISAAVVFFTNSGIVDNVDKIGKDSAVQTAGNDLKDNFLLCRVAAIRLLSTTDAAVYDSFVAQADISVNDYTRLYKLIDQNSFLEKFRPAFQKAEADFHAYLAKANELGAANADEESQIEKMNAAGALMAEYGDLIFRDQIQLLREEIAGGSVLPDAMSRRVDRIESGADIALNIMTARLYAREMMASFDTKNLPTALEALDEAYALTETYNKASSIPKNVENSQFLMDSLAEYRANLVEFAAACDHAKSVSDVLGPLGLTALESLSAAVYQLDDAMTGQVQNTTASASASRIIVMLISVASVLVAIVLAFIIVKGITTPVAKMVRAADSLSLGDVNVDARYNSRDEIGSLSASFEKMLDGIKSQVSIVERLADGDLTVSISPRSEKDAMNFGLKRMVDSLSGMFGEINASTAQVSAGSKQIADGAQSLAQGSTQQAAAVQQLSSSITEIAEKTKANAKLAERAANLANAIKDNAEKGSRQMDEMIIAVRGINQASQSINKVIKVIDDIAFQTNILALNAAVEAARAGQHGKGFAVVAEEVRNLAAKSAEAAKDTGGLIANSMEKAEMGARIADNTAASLTDIVAGINESSSLVIEIARSSDEQSEGIYQINKGIEQVAQVVQQNSATAEESAAASEQMSGQASILEGLVSQFKIKDSVTNRFQVGSPRHTAIPEKSFHEFSDDSEGFGKY